MQRTLVLIKPDAVQRGLSGEIIARLERRGLKLVGMKMLHVTRELAHRHYGAHVTSRSSRDWFSSSHRLR